MMLEIAFLIILILNSNCYIPIPDHSERAHTLSQYDQLTTSRFYLESLAHCYLMSHFQQSWVDEKGRTGSSQSCEIRQNWYLQNEASWCGDIGVSHKSRGMSPGGWEESLSRMGGQFITNPTNCLQISIILNYKRQCPSVSQ